MIYATLIGYIGRDPETRVSPQGTKVTTFSICVEEDFWVKCIVFGSQYDKMLNFIKKGASLMVYAKVSKPKIYQNKQGAPATGLEAVVVQMNFLPKGKTQEQSSNPVVQENNYEDLPF